MYSPSKTWTIYAVTNKVNGKQYVGLTKSLQDRVWHHVNQRGKHSSPLLKKALDKYGIDAFAFLAIATCMTRSDACYVEIELIRDLRTKVPNGYNLTDGGEGAGGYKQSAASIAKRVIKLKGKKRSQEAIKKTAGAHRGRKHTPDSRLRMSMAHRGKKLNAAQLAALSYGRSIPQTQQQREKIAAAQRGVPRPYASELCRRTMTGRVWPKEVVAKRVAAIVAAKLKKKAERRRATMELFVDASVS